MPVQKILKIGSGYLILLVVIIGLAGCYTVLRHPSVAEEETGVVYENRISGVSCTDCHNNEYDHRWMSPHGWGYGYWGSGYSPYYYYGYSGWNNYYYNPWWNGWWYYNPYPYYPSGGGNSVPGAPSPERPHSRRGDLGPPTGSPPPAYTPPPPESQGQPQPENQQNQSDKRKGRRGKS